MSGAAGALGLGAAVGGQTVVLMANKPRRSSPVPPTDPFTLGVASGDPWPDSVVLWTRLVTRFDDPDDTGIQRRPQEVDWELASDPSLTRIERRGTVWARPEQGHSVHVVADGLRPGREYWYRFRCGPWVSPVGRTKTAPSPGRAVSRLDLAVASCQSWAAGYYTVHRHLAADAPDAVVFLGDYLYELPIDPTDSGRRLDVELPPHLLAEAGTLATYRARYAWYQRDPDLQAAHQAAPWIATWDDHEVEDNYAAGVAGSGGTSSPDRFARRRRAAYQAYWEHLPLRTAPPQGASMRMHRRLAFGSLASIHVLDTRQHRSDQIAGPAWQRTEGPDSSRTMLGRRQQQWVAKGLANSTATWDIVAQQVVASHLHVDARDHGLVNVDTWDGYPDAQRLLYEALATAANPVVLTGDLHAAYAFDIRAARARRDDETIGVEFAVTSISSGGDGADLSAAGQRFLDATPHLHYANQRRGYARCRVTPTETVVDFRVVPHVTDDAQAPVRTDRSFVVEAGRRGVREA